MCLFWNTFVVHERGNPRAICMVNLGGFESQAGDNLGFYPDARANHSSNHPEGCTLLEIRSHRERKACRNPA